MKQLFLKVFRGYNKIILVAVISLLGSNFLYAQSDPLFIDSSGNVNIQVKNSNRRFSVEGNATFSDTVQIDVLKGSQVLTILTNTAFKEAVQIGNTLEVGSSTYFYKNVRIGMTNPTSPKAALEISGYMPYKYDQAYSFLRFWKKTDETNKDIGRYKWKTEDPPIPVSIYAENSIIGGEFNAISDQRIKKVVGLSNSFFDLETINQFKVTDYTYCDVVTKGRGHNKGFLAQEVELLFPQAVNKYSDFIPDIYAPAEKTVLNKDILTIVMNKAHNLHTGDLVKLITETQGTKEVFVNVVEDKIFTVRNWKGEYDQLFIYGKKVDDFRTVDYQQIFSMGISAIQELSKQVNKLKLENAKLKNDNAVTLQSLTAMQLQLALLQKKVEALVAPAVIAGK